ncbi:hypothetical protein [Miltoncostaea oceani]|uniref:hypothetical protein n=1 Tax=Miltoncostaea oceani TaxID=2843216 RepID=UPI001C3D064E|nr:hypothetical protein [Miltoncostaea oceani]
MNHDPIIDELRRMNPVPGPIAAADSHELRERTWSRMGEASPASTAPGRHIRAGGARRRAFILAGVILLVAAAIAGASLIANELRGPAAPDPAGFGVDRAGAAFLGEQEGVRYFRTRSGDSTCLSRTLPGTEVEGGRSCAPPDQLADAGGLIGVQKLGPSYLVAGFLPPGIDSALVAGERVPVREDGFLMARADENPGIAVRVYGPGVGDAIAALRVYTESVISDPPDGPSYEVLTTPWN